MSLLESAPLREWGTRYDTLSTSPSPSTTSSLSRINPPTTCTSTANSSLIASVDAAPTKSRAQGDRLSHEASVFVGSLPTNVDHAELSARLKDHLSAYVDVNLVRIIRDSRGGVCAFVQCNDSASAAQLIQRVRSQPPQSFMGRYLRFEPARSQRTLWISYRKPVEVICDPDHGRFLLSCNSSGRAVEFDLPKAMKICRTPGSRRISILYNAQALHPDGNTNPSLSHPLQDQDAVGSVLTSVGLVLSPLRFDSQTLHRIASSFGPLESFDLCQPEPAEDNTEYRVYPYPHNADRSEGMDPGCWEIKWENRNDCLSALATLRSVPHLTVTWPNQQHALIPRRSGPFNRHHHVKDQLVFKRPSGLQQVFPRHCDENNVTSQTIPPLGSSSSSWKHKLRTATVTVGSPSSSEHPSPQNDDDLPVTTDDWTIVDSANHADFHVPPTFPDTMSSKELQVSHDSPCGAPPETKDDRERGCNEAPCIDGVPSSLSSNRLGLSEFVSNNAAHPKGQVAALSPVSPLHAPARGGNARSPSPGPVNQPDTPFVENLASPFSPRSPRAVKPRVGALDFYDAFAIPPAPQWSEVRPRRRAGPCDENIDVSLRAFDPTTIFVGGLEVHGRCTWDEQRLKSVFGQYGEIVEVKLVRPVHRKSAFAFVTYKSNKSSARAVLAEHNRVYDGRHIRVQLRDSAVQRIQGSKPNFKSSNGRPFSPRHQAISRVNSSPVDIFPHIQNGVVPAIIPVPCEESGPVLTNSPNGTASDTRGNVPDNTCVAVIPSQASSTMVSGVPPMTYPPPAPAAFYAPAPWFMHSYPYVHPPHIVPGYSPIPLTSSMVNANEAGRPIPPGNMYQPIPHYSVYPLPLPPIPPTTQQHLELASLPERRAPLQPTGFIESEQGLIPVYAPEALGEYMASTNSYQNAPEPGGSHSLLHPLKAIPDTRPKAAYAMHPQHQYHATFAGDRGGVMMAAPSQFPNAPSLVPVGTGFDWYRDTTYAEYRPQEGPRCPAVQTIEAYQGGPTGQPPRCHTYSERGFGFSRRRGQSDGSTFARTGRSSNHPGTYSTRRRGYFKHTGGAVSMSAVIDETVETGKGDVDSVADSDAVIRASTSSPAVFDLTPTSPTRGAQM